MGLKERRLQHDIIYGPIDSRRLGSSLGVNILPTRRKVCSFDCLYCQYGYTPVQKERWHVDSEELPTPGEVAEALMNALPRHGDIDAITLAGNGEPTLHPDFRKICEIVVRQRDMYLQSAEVCILSNSSTVGSTEVRFGLNLLDRPIMKLDAGTQAAFEKLNRPRPGVRLEKIVDGLARLDTVEIQTLFVTGPVDNTTDAELEAWLECMRRIRPRAVQLYTFERRPADVHLHPADSARLEKIADRLATELPDVEVHLFLPAGHGQ